MDNQEKIRTTYWESEDFSRSYQMGAQKHRLYILDKLKELEVKSLLDVGCGTGPIYELLINAEEGRWDNIHQYKGTDYSWQMIETAKENFPEGNFEVQDARFMDEPDNSWDCVLIMHCLDHLDDYQSAIAEAVRVSKKYICICLWRGFVNQGTNLNSRNEMGKKKDEQGNLLEPAWSDTHLQEYSREALIKEFDKHGLIDVDIAEGEEVNSDQSKYNYVWILKKPST